MFPIRPCFIVCSSAGKRFSVLINEALARHVPKAAGGRPICIIDGTTVPKADADARKKNGLWHIHAAFSLPAERFRNFELTDEKGGETLDRIPVVKGEIRLADRAFLQPDRMAAVLEAGADVVVRAGWKGAKWLQENGQPFDLIARPHAHAETGRIDMPIWIGRKGGKPLSLRLIAIKKPADAAETSRRTAHREARRGGHTLSRETLEAADWMLIITSLPPSTFSANDISGYVSVEMAHRTRLQTLEKHVRIERSAGQRRAIGQTVDTGPFTADYFARTRRRRVRGLSPLATCRLTRPGAWRLLEHLVAALLQAIFPPPTLDELRRGQTELRRHLHEPPRRRDYQRMAKLF